MIMTPEGLNRYEELVQKYESYPPVTGAVLLYGSSFFTRWGYERARAQLSGIRGGVVCHGIGGATGDELLFNYGRLVYPFKPAAMVLRAGVNDIGRGYSPEEAAAAAIRVCEWNRANFPGCKNIVMPSFDFISAPEKKHYRLYKAFNAIMLEYAESTENTAWLDISPFLHNSPASAGTYTDFRDDLFGPDGLHLTDEGYEKIAPWFTEQVNALLQEEN